MIFLTVGSMFTFDRLVRAVDEAAGRAAVFDEVFAQVGIGGYRPRNMKFAETLEREVYREYVAKSKAMIGHAGMGTILMALDAGRPLLVMPRLKRFGEIVNDHQVATAERFASNGYVLEAADERQIEAKLAQLKTFVPRARKANPAPVVARVSAALDEIAAKRRARGRE